MPSNSIIQQTFEKLLLFIIRTSAEFMFKYPKSVLRGSRDWYYLLFVEEDVPKLYGKLMSWLRFTGGVAYEYNETSGKFAPVTGSKMWHFLISGALGELRAFVCLIGCLTDDRIWEDLLVKGLVNANHLIVILNFAVTISASLMYWIAWRNSKALMVWINFSRFSNVTFEELFGQQVPRTSVRVQRSYVLVILLIPAGVLGAIGAYSTDHVWSIKLSENLFRGNVGPVANLACFLVDVWVVAYGTVALYWVFAALFFVAFAIMDVMTALRLQEGRIAEQLKMYTVVKLFAGSLNSVFRNFVPGGLLGICLLTALANYIVLNIRYLLTFGYLLTSLGLFIVVCVGTAQMYMSKMLSWMAAESEGLLEDLRQRILEEKLENPSRALYFQKRLRAMETLYFNCGNFCKIGKRYHVTHLSMLLDQSINLLLTYKCA